MNDIQIERRYAILIGIDNYTEKSKLDYAVKDAKKIKQLLVERCQFSDSDIHFILSSEDHPISDITGHLFKTYSEIQKSFVPEKDSVFFYFAGHGETHFNESSIAFHDTLFPVREICTSLSSLKPKFLSCIIDACESGGKVMTRGTTNQSVSNPIEKYLEQSSGTLFMFACQEDEKAYELEKMGQGLFTYHFVEALNKSTEYDEHGILVPEKIITYVKKNTIDGSKFRQNPVVELRSPGYYPFAFTKEAINKLKKKKTAPASLIETVKSKKIGTHFPVIPPNIRLEVFELITKDIMTAFSAYAERFEKQDSYTIAFSEDFGALPDAVFEKAKEKIVIGARREIVAAGELFSTSTEPIQNNWLRLNFMDSFLRQNEPKYETIHRIDFSSNNVYSCNFNLKSTNIRVPSCGFGLVMYQALYGIGLATFTYHFDWNGYFDAKLGPLKVEFTGFKVQDGVMEKVSVEIKELFKLFDSSFNSFSDKREKEIDAFDRIAK